MFNGSKFWKGSGSTFDGPTFGGSTLGGPTLGGPTLDGPTFDGPTFGFGQKVLFGVDSTLIIN